MNSASLDSVVQKLITPNKDYNFMFIDVFAFLLTSINEEFKKLK